MQLKPEEADQNPPPTPQAQRTRLQASPEYTCHVKLKMPTLEDNNGAPVIFQSQCQLKESCVMESFTI